MINKKAIKEERREEKQNEGEKNRSQIDVQAQGEESRHEMSLVTSMDAVGNDPWGAELDKRWAERSVCTAACWVQKVQE